MMKKKVIMNFMVGREFCTFSKTNSFKIVQGPPAFRGKWWLCSLWTL